jgi:putative ABC transport system permease protein
MENLRQRSLRSWLTMIGIFIGIAAVVALISLGQGMKVAISAQFVGLGADTITVQAAGGGFGPPGSYQASLITDDDLRAIKRTQGIDAAFGRLIEAVSVKVDDNQYFGYLVSLPEEMEDYRLSLVVPTKLETDKGRMVVPGDGNRLVIGNDLSTKDRYGKRLRVGDKITVQDTDFEVVGVLKKTGNPQYDGTLFASEDAVREVTGEPEKLGIILAKADTGVSVDAAVANIEKELRREREVEKGEEDFSVESSQDILKSLNKILGAVQAVLIGIAAISLLVGGVGITNTMYTAVLERTKEIGVMKAIGARNSDVLTIFLIESGLLGMAGGAIGVAIGMGLAFMVQAIAAQVWGTALIEAHFSFLLIFGSLAFSFIVGAIAGLTPARQAAKMHPVEALSHD